MIDIKDKYNCFGCELCANACPVNAIEMKPDNLGFCYPIVNIDKCIDCSKCERVCPLLNVTECIDEPIVVYAARHNNISVVKESRSGGVFTAISDKILEDGGMIAGAISDTPYTVRHILSENPIDRDLMRGSKYIQSSMSDIYQKVLSALQSGRVVLFSGTPCQVAAMKKYVPDRYKDNLYTIDIVCHGVSSPEVWRSYLDYLSHKMSDRPQKVNFRDKKTMGWEMHRESVDWMKAGERIAPFTFYHDAWLRPACHKCKFSSFSRIGDITLGDLWKWRNCAIELNMDNLGISSIFCNTDKGKDLFNRILPNLIVKSIQLSQAVQPNLIAPTPEIPTNKAIVKIYTKKGYKSALRRLGVLGWRKHVKLLRYFFYRIINKLKLHS